MTHSTADVSESDVRRPSLVGAPLRTGMAYPLTDAQRRLRLEVRSFAESELMPIADELDNSDEFSDELADLIHRSGLMRHFLPPELGGLGLSVTNIGLIREELGRVSPRADEFFAAQGIATQPVILWGTESQRRRVAEGLLSGSMLLAYCMTEPGAGSDVAGISTTVTEVGDELRVTGTKRFIHAAHRSTIFLVLATTDPALGKRGVTALLFDRPGSGVSTTPYPLLLSSPTFEVSFDACAIPASSLLGPRGRGIAVALSNLDRLRPTVGASVIGSASRALEAAIDRVGAREAFGGHLGDLPTIRHSVAVAAARLDAARLAVYAAAANADAGDEAVDVSATSAKAKLLATETACEVVDLAVQLHGGAGLARGSLTERFYRAVRAARIYEGASEVMELVISRSVMDRRAPAT